MKKTTGVLGLVVVVAAACTAGAWYTGKQLPEVLSQAVAQANAQLKLSAGDVTLELASVESHLYSSTVHYRIKANNLMVGEELRSFELGFVDRVEHGPLPWSRLKALKLMPVMAYSNYALEKDAVTADWFAASGDVPPIYGHNSLGYDGSTDGTFIMPPMELSEAGQSLVKFSGLNVQATGTRNAEQVTFSGNSANLNFNLVDQSGAPVKIALKDLSLVGTMNKAASGFYFGKANMALGEVSVATGPQQKVLLMKGLEQNSQSEADGAKLSGTVAYKVADINFDGQPVGSSEMLWRLQNLDMDALQALAAWHQSRLPEFQAAAAQGEVFPSLPMNEAEKTQVYGNVQQVLAAKPQIALENFSFKTANGESRFSLSVDLAKPASLELPPAELYKQMIAQVQSSLQLSKPMIGDLAVLQARLAGQSDAQVLSAQASQAGEMVGMMAVQSQMATVQGNDIVTRLHYADGMVDFNGQKLTVEQFASLIMANLGAVRPSEG